MKKVGVLIIVMYFNVTYAENLQKGDNDFNVTTEKLFPEVKESELTFKVGVQTVSHDYGVSAGLGDSDALDVGFSQASDLDLEATFKKDAYGIYIKYKTDLEDPSLSLNKKSLFSNSNNDKLSVGSFLLYDDQTGIIVESLVDNSSVTIIPNKIIAFDDNDLANGKKYNFNIGHREYKIGISNNGKKKSNAYIGLTTGVKKDFLNLPVFDKENNRISNARYSGDGVFASISFGLKPRSLNLDYEMFRATSMKIDIDYSRGVLSLPTGNESINKTNIKQENSFYLNKNTTISYISGINSLVKENTLSNIGGVLAIAGSGALGYALYSRVPSSIVGTKLKAEKNGWDVKVSLGKNTGNSFTTMMKSVAVSAATTYIGSKLSEKMYNYKNKSYLNDTFYGVKVNYEFD